jgi:hypothetical protein
VSGFFSGCLAAAEDGIICGGSVCFLGCKAATADDREICGGSGFSWRRRLTGSCGCN